MTMHAIILTLSLFSFFFHGLLSAFKNCYYLMAAGIQVAWAYLRGGVAGGGEQPPTKKCTRKNSACRRTTQQYCRI